MRIASFNHKGLRNLCEQDDGRRVRADQIDRLRLILSALDQANGPTSVSTRRAHRPCFLLVVIFQIHVPRVAV